MNALREREINNNLERRLSEEQKLRGEPNLWLLFKSGPEFFCINVDCHFALATERVDRAAQTESIRLLIFSRTCCKK